MYLMANKGHFFLIITIRILYPDKVVTIHQQTSIHNTSLPTECTQHALNNIEESVNTKFLGLQIDSHQNWTNHIDKTIPKLSVACYAVTFMCHLSKQ
jgi:hypothetical protein